MEGAHRLLGLISRNDDGDVPLARRLGDRDDVDARARESLEDGCGEADAPPHPRTYERDSRETGADLGLRAREPPADRLARFGEVGGLEDDRRLAAGRCL